ncbi:class I SAM-dependent DNA methyltransferase [Streptomyces huiliensis]|uniref:class I SAM-dependent DNA methyltransferase n=1 Tax=Streptomyces huiliensis TaxID=2876027 RepID=UPI001CC1299C|nr:class I SAM-dependent methyltransferase [Streptomyces huiliensis]
MTPQYDRIADQYGEVDRLLHAYRETVEIPSLLRALGPVDGASVLDLGCGTGPFTRLLRREGAADVLGVDASEPMVGLALREEAEEPLGVRYEVRDIVDLPALGAFDVVTAAAVLHYADSFDTLTRMCRGAYANLAPGGRLLAVVGNARLTPEVPLPNGFVLHRPAHPRDGDPCTITIPTTPPSTLTVHFWTSAAYERVLADCGFTDVTWEPLHGLPAGTEPVNLIFTARRGGGDGTAPRDVGARMPVG